MRLASGAISSVILVGLSLYWAVSTFTGIEETFSTEDLLAFAGTGISTLLVQILIVLVVDRWLEKPLLTYAVSGLFIVLNAFSFNLAFARDFLLLGLPPILLALAAGWFIAAVIVRIADESTRVRPYVFAVIAALIVSPFVVMALRSEAPIETMGNSEYTASPIIRKVDFKMKPNVYFIGFESAAPAAILKKYLRAEQAPLPDALRKNGFRVFKNLFSEATPTKRSWNSLLSLDRSYFLTMQHRKDHLLSGASPSPLIQIFKHNGYEVSTLFRNSFFGERKGSFIDNYYINSFASVCDFMGLMEKLVAFYGACFLRESELFPRGKVVEGQDIKYLRYQILKTSKRNKPQLFFAHFYPPVHVNKKTFKGTPEQVRAFRHRYVNSSAAAGRNLKKIRDLVRAYDPNSLLFVFGDHGILLSNVVNFADDKMFYIQDRHGVLGGIFPASACSDIFNRAQSQPFHTTAGIARLIVQCLANGVDPFSVEYKHDHVHVDGELIPVNEYLYETGENEEVTTVE